LAFGLHKLLVLIFNQKNTNKSLLYILILTFAVQFANATVQIKTTGKTSIRFYSDFTTTNNKWNSTNKNNRQKLKSHFAFHFIVFTFSFANKSLSIRIIIKIIRRV
jgi:hypothetical protein